MNKLVFYSLSMIAMMCFSCKQNDECDRFTDFPFFTSLEIKEDPKTNFKNGIFTVDVEIKSDYKGEAFIMLALRQVNNEKSKNCEPYYRGFGNDVQVDGYQIRSYHQLIKYRLDAWFNEKNPCYSPFDANAPKLDFPVFVKKLQLLKGSVREKINIRLPDGFNWCWGETVVFRNDHAIEESMKTKVDPNHKGDATYIHRQFFPDSSMFSFLITSYQDLCHFVEWTEKEVAYNCNEPRMYPVRGMSDPVSFGVHGYKDGDGNRVSVADFPIIFW